MNRIAIEGWHWVSVHSKLKYKNRDENKHTHTQQLIHFFNFRFSFNWMQEIGTIRRYAALAIERKILHQQFSWIFFVALCHWHLIRCTQDNQRLHSYRKFVSVCVFANFIPHERSLHLDKRDRETNVRHWFIDFGSHQSQREFLFFSRKIGWLDPQN